MRVVTLGMSMPGVHGISLIEQIKFEKPLVRVLVLTMYPEEIYAIRALKAGAGGFVINYSTYPSLHLSLPPTDRSRPVADTHSCSMSMTVAHRKPS